MPASLRELRQRRTSVATTKKITRAMELIAASRIIKAQQAAQAALPYTRELNQAVAAVCSYSDVSHPLTREAEHPTRSALLLITSDRGLAGAYSSSAIKMAERLTERLRAEGKEVDNYLVGRKAISYYQFRNRPIKAQWDGFSDSPTAQDADRIADTLIAAFMAEPEAGGVDEIQVVYTRFESMLTQEPRVRRVLPVRVVRGADAEPAEGAPFPLYEFEPDAITVLNALMPQYVRNRIYFYLRSAAASELASRQRAMKSATDNAQQLIERLTREANQARQAEITQEISEIVGGASALAEATAQTD